MNRREFLHQVSFSFLLMGGRFKKFKFRIKTKNKSIINVVIEGYDIDNAKFRLKKRYPDCEILSSKEL